MDEDLFCECAEDYIDDEKVPLWKLVLLLWLFL